VPPPKTLGDAKRSAWWEGYKGAIEEELGNLEKLGCWEVVHIKSIPRGTNILRSKFVFDDKRGPDGKFLKFKARMVAMGFTQVEGVDYNDTFASVMITKSFRTLLAIWNLDPTLVMEHWDIKQAFVNAPLDETIYVHPVVGFGEPGQILKLKKALYGTKQAAHAWQKFLKRILVGLGGVPHLKDECVFIFREPSTGGWLFLSTHVDDLFPLYNREGILIRDRILGALGREVTVENKGDLSWALSTKIERDVKNGVLKISQEEDVNSLLREHGLEDLGEEDTPTFDKGGDSSMSEVDLPKSETEKLEVEKFPFHQIIGKLWWLALISRPDIVFAVHRCACWQNKPSAKLRRWVLRIVKYLKKTKKLGLVFEREKYNSQEVMVGVCDASFLGEEKSMSRYGVLFFVGGCLIHWASAKTSRIVSSSTEAETHGLIHLGKENIWEREFHGVLGYFTGLGPTKVFQDNKAAISLSTGGTCHKRSKHFGLEFDMFREYVGRGELVIEYKPTGELVADLLTKPLPPGKFTGFRDEMMGGQRAQSHFG
jgi:hypothetical protein